MLRRKRFWFCVLVLMTAALLLAATNGNLEWTQLRSDNRRGSTAGAIGQSACGSVTNTHIAAFDSTGCLVDGGAGGGGSGTVTSVAAAVPSGFTISGSPVTTSGTLTIGYATGLTTHQVLGTGSSGALALVSLTGADLPNPSSSTLGGIQSIAAVSNEWVDSISTSGVPHLSQPAFSNISGTVAASQLPTPTTSTFGGIEDIAAVTHKWIDSIVNGVPHLSQPAESDLSFTDITTNNVGTSKHGFAPKGTGSSTQYLDGTGAYSTPVGTGLGSLILLEQHTASSSATLDFTSCISSSYDTYEIVIVSVIPASNNVDLELLMSTDGGSTYDTTHYGNTDFFNYTSTGVSSSTTTYLRPAGSISNDSARPGVNGRIMMYSPGLTSRHRFFTGESADLDANAGVLLRNNWAGAFTNTSAAVNAFRFLFSGGGNIASGTVRCYGYSK